VVDFFGQTEELKNSEDWTHLAASSDEFSKKTVNDVMKYPLSRRNPFFPVHPGYSLLHAIEIMAREKGLHRIPVIDDDRKLITIITQSQLVQILAKNLDIIGEKKNKPVMLMESYFEEVFAIQEDAIAMDAFRMMIDKNVSGLAVVDKEGKLIAAISMRDIKAMSVDGRLFWRLFQTVHNFLLKVRKENTETKGERPRTIVTTKGEETLEIVVNKLFEHKIHRIFVVDDHKKPIGVISLKDVLHEIIS